MGVFVTPRKGNWADATHGTLWVYCGPRGKRQLPRPSYTVGVKPAPPIVRTLVGAASYFGGPADPGTGHIGYRGDDLNVHPDSFAELDMGTSLGGLAYGAAVRVVHNGKSIILYKRDIGAGGGGVGGYARVIDLWYTAAQKIGCTGLDIVTIQVLR